MAQPSPPAPVAVWVLERCPNERFPYRLQIIRNGSPYLVLRAQDRWPTANRNIFCLRETEDDPAEERQEVERVPVVGLSRRGVRISVVLDRPRLKRCDFLLLTREYKGRPGSYEQIYWQTQAGMRQRRVTVPPPSLRAAASLEVRIASDERYPWRFAGSVVTRGRLPAGDYALVDGERVLAIVERKTFENFLGDIATLPVLHQRLFELSRYENAALVVEAPYERFLDPARVHHSSPSYCAAVIAELYVRFPRLRIVFCANRKAANAWTQHFFAAVRALVPARSPDDANAQ